MSHRLPVTRRAAVEVARLIKGLRPLTPTGGRVLPGTEATIAIALGIGLTPFIEWLILRSRQPHGRRDVASGETILEYGRSLRTFSIAGTAFFGFLGVIATGALDPSSPVSDRSLLIALALLIPWLVAFIAVGVEFFPRLCQGRKRRPHAALAMERRPVARLGRDRVGGVQHVQPMVCASESEGQDSHLQLPQRDKRFRGGCDATDSAREVADSFLHRSPAVARGRPLDLRFGEIIVTERVRELPNHGTAILAMRQ